MGSATISVDEFQALEQKVLQTVELIKREREAKASAESARAEAEAEVALAYTQLSEAKAERDAAHEELERLRHELAMKGDAQTELESLQKEREAVRLRVETMLAHIDEVM